MSGNPYMVMCVVCLAASAPGASCGRILAEREKVVQQSMGKMSFHP